MCLSIEPPDLARAKADLAAFVAADEAPVELAERDITLFGGWGGLVRSPGWSRYSSTLTKSFSKTVLYLSGSVRVGSFIGHLSRGSMG
jgi:hypothetical protein